MSFFQAFSPSKPSKTIDQNNLLALIRDRVFQLILIIFTFLAISVAVAVTIIVLQSGQLVNIPIAWSLVFFIGVITFFRNFPYRIRVFGFSAILFVAATYLLLSTGFSTHGLLLMMGFVIIVTLFNGVTDGIISGVIALASIFLAGGLITTGTFSLPPVLPATNPGFEWLIGGLSFLGLSSIAIGTITVTFNALQHTVKNQDSLISSLADEKNNMTSMLSKQSNELEVFNHHIDLHTEVNRLFTEQKGTAQFLSDVVNLIEKAYSLYHVGVYLKGENGDSVILQAATGETGRVLAEQKFHLKIAKNSIIGYVALNNEPRYAPNVEDDSSYYQNPMLPYTRCELSIPISYQNRVLGILDLQADHENAFSSSDIRSFQLLGNLIGALVSSRMMADRLEKVQQDVDQSGKSNIRQSWRNHLQTTRRIYGFQFKDQKLTTDTVPDEHSQSAVENENLIRQTDTLENGSRQTILALPIKLRGQVIGVLDMHFNGASIPQDLMQLLDATSNRLALALENARLLEELKMRAERERLVGDISARVRSSTAVQDILGAAAVELGRSLGVSEVVVQLRSTEE